jgi:hypothetical protein
MRAPAGVVPLVALFAACTVYVAAFPNHLGDSDEPLILYEAKRLLDGEVMYRDVFEIITPGSQYLFAGLFALFGATLTTARLAMALVHAAIATLIAIACRRCDVRWPLAIAAAVAHLALGQPVWPYASPHWLSTLLTMLALVLALGRPWAAGGRGGLALGAVLGGLAMVQQQKAALLLPAVVLAMLADRLVDRRYPPPAPHPSLPAQLAAVLAGVMLVAAPVMAAIVALAGVGPVFDALIRHPLTSYPALHAASARWGSVSIFSLPLAWYTRPALLRWQPLVMLGVGLRVAALCWRRAGEAEVRRLLILLWVAGGATASIMYFPDFIHLAFIAPLFVVGLAALLEVGVRRLPRLLAPVVCAALLLALSVQATRNLRRAHATHTVRAETRFGRLDLRNRQLLDAAAEMDRLLPPGAPREVFCYPECPALYLLAGADNPTPYQKLLTGYNSPEVVQAALDTVERRRPPLAFGFFAVDTDPVTQYVLAHYTRVGTSLFYTRNPDAN